MASVVNEASTFRMGSDASAAASIRVTSADRVTCAVSLHYDFVWRSLRRLGVFAEAADDAAQEVFCVFAKRVAEVPVEKEKTFLFGVAIRVAQNNVRKRGRRSAVIVDVGGDERLAEVASGERGPDELVDDARARATLDSVLARMPIEHRAVFILYEVEEMTMADIASVLEIPAGTVASRLRRAREMFAELAKAHRGVQ